MATLMHDSDGESGPAKVVVIEQNRQNARLLLAVAALLTGLSIAVPAAMLVFVYPLNRAEYHWASGPGWVGVTWWPVVYASIALSVGCGLAGIVLVTRRRVRTYRPDEGSSINSSRLITARPDMVLMVASLGLILAPFAYLGETNVPLAPGLVGLGLAGIAVAVWGVSGADPAVTRLWLFPFSVAAFLVILLGNAYVFLLFGFLGLSL